MRWRLYQTGRCSRSLTGDFKRAIDAIVFRSKVPDLKNAVPVRCYSEETKWEDAERFVKK